MTAQSKTYPVAVVGMHGRFPDAYDIKDFWTNICEGNNTVKLVPEERWDWKSIFGSSANESENTSINCACFMPLVDRFDPGFFGIMPREAESMDPQQRLFLQTAFAAVEDAGYAPNSLSGTNTGVFVGIGNADYPMMMRRDGAAFDIYRATGLALTSIANRVSFAMDIHGPSESIDTACSGSLVAIHRAIQSMQYGECEKAIVGGVNLLVGPDLFIAFDKAGMLSKSARCRTFDSKANGYVRGEGVAALVLCPLEVAEKNGDYIYAVIQGSAENHGGRAHSFTAPNASAQAKVVMDAWRKSGRSFHEASMIETHGTGTPLGDPIEVNGLKIVNEEVSVNVDTAASTINPHIALGALKSHVGHLEATAGIAGVIKTILSFKYRLITQNLNFESLNPHIDLSTTPYYLPTQNITLKASSSEEIPHVAGVSSFGFGGVNAHIVIESSPYNVQGPNEATTHPYLIPLSGKNKTALYNRVRQLIDFLEEGNNEFEQSRLSYDSILASLSSSFGIEHSFDTEASFMMASGNTFEPTQWRKALNNLQPLVGKKIDLAEVIDCLTLQEAAQRIFRSWQVDHLTQQSSLPALCTRVAVPQTEIYDVTLAQIARTLIEGRDHYKERLVCVTHSKKDLLVLLRRFLASPDQPQFNVWTHSIKHNDLKVEKPEIGIKGNNVEWLEALANWWVTTKNASLKWSDIYIEIARPKKFPLPTYPFQLDKIWYHKTTEQSDKTQILQSSQQAETLYSHQITVPVDSKVETSNGIYSTWKAYQSNSQIIIPSSVMSLAALLDYGNYKAQGEWNIIENVQFGRPCDVNEEDMVFSYSIEQSEAVIQCLTSRKDPKILIQASMRLDCDHAHNELFDDVSSSTDATLGIDEFQALLKKNHVLLGLMPFIDKVQISNQQLKFYLNIPNWKAKENRFWYPLMMSMLSGFAFYTEQHKPFALPWKIKKIMYSPDQSRTAKALYIKFDPERNKFSVIVIDEQSKILIKLDEIVLHDSQIREFPIRSIDYLNATETLAGAI